MDILMGRVEKARVRFPEKRGLKFSHAGHQQKTSLPCTDCHAFGPGQRAMPNHQLCSICHETEGAAGDARCSPCDARGDGAVDDLAPHSRPPGLQ